ncbi:MAG TPA: hypothetical protein VGC88_12005, partial [Terriglobales bacterium]
MRIPKIVSTVLFVLSLLTFGFAQNPLGYDFVRTQGFPNGVGNHTVVYDSSLKTVYSTNSTTNRIDMIDGPTRKLVGAIDVPQPTAVDVSVDGTQLGIASSTGYVYIADVASKSLKQRFFIGQGLSDLVYLSDGTLLVSTVPVSIGTYFVLDPQAGTVTPVSFTNPNACCFSGVFARSGDHTKVAVYQDSRIFIFDGASHSVTASKTYDFTTSINTVQLNGDGSKVVATVRSFTANYASVLNSSLIEQAQLNGIQGPFVLSAAGTKMFVGGGSSFGRTFAEVDTSTGTTLFNFADFGLLTSFFGSTARVLTENNTLVGVTFDGITFIDTARV